MADLTTIQSNNGINLTTNAGGDTAIETTQTNGDIQINSIIENADSQVPQIQSVVKDNDVILSSIVNAPFVEVTSVNGLTGDVTVKMTADEFQTNTVYGKGAIIIHNGNLYYANEEFTSGDTFDENNWGQIKASQSQANWTQTDNTKVDYIKNKPTINLQTVTDTSNETTNNLVVKNNGNTITLSSDGTWLTSGMNGKNTTLSDKIKSESITYFESEKALTTYLAGSDVPSGEWYAAVKEAN